MKTNENDEIEVQDEIEVHGIKYVRKYVQTIYNAVPASEMAKYLFKCGAPACNR